MNILKGFLVVGAFSYGVSQAAPQPVMASLERLKALKVPLMYSNTELGIGVAQVNDEQREALSRMAHDRRECGGYSLLSGALETQVNLAFRTMSLQRELNQAYLQSFKALTIKKKPEIASAVDKVSADNLHDFLKWYSSFETRYERDQSRGMAAVNALKGRLEDLTASVRSRVSVSLIDHNRTTQKSIRVRFTGTTRPKEIVVLGGHLDSVNWEQKNGHAPGADDNGSGTSNLFELVRILSETPATERTIDVFFYAAEETGLIGSAEIAQNYKITKQDVIGVMQLDMTLYAGSGEGVIGLTRDYTSAWLNSYLEELNRNYVGARLIDDKCDYACSDHASWHERGFAATFPFEATMQSYNRDIHTERDQINNASNFRHSALFSKLGVAFAMDLANSGLREPSIAMH